MRAEPLIVWTEEPLNAETPLSLLCGSEVTSTQLFFVRNHGSVPAVDPDGYRLVLGGALREPLILSLRNRTGAQCAGHVPNCRIGERSVHTRLVLRELLGYERVRDYENGAALVEDWAPKERKLPAEAVPLLRTIESGCAVRERCRLRRLRRVDPSRSRR